METFINLIGWQVVSGMIICHLPPTLLPIVFNHHPDHFLFHGSWYCPSLKRCSCCISSSSLIIFCGYKIQQRWSKMTDWWIRDGEGFNLTNETMVVVIEDSQQFWWKSKSRTECWSKRKRDGVLGIQFGKKTCFGNFWTAIGYGD